jgi:hypothetical protein
VFVYVAFGAWSIAASAREVAASRTCISSYVSRGSRYTHGVRVAFVGAAVVLSACGFRPASGTGDVDAAIDGSDIPIDAPDAPPGVTCYGSLETICFTDPPQQASLDLDSAIDTGTDDRCDATVTDACVVFAGTITVSGTVRVTGPRPLILLATTGLTVASGGTLDASSADATVGAAANSSSCTAPQAPSDGDGQLGGNGTSGGGGAGGTFGAQGSPGGIGSTTVTNIAAGTAPAALAINTLRGGCAGGQGGKGGNTDGGAGGASGGAVYLIAGLPGGSVTLHVDGKIFASGAKGLGAGAGAHSTGGGGGGSGGMIALEAGAIAVGATAVIAANGGGGAGGGGASDGGANGGNGTTTSFTAQASGGNGDDNASGDGGKGSTLGHLRGDTGTNGTYGGGGGGGGAVGVVWTKGTVSDPSRCSPAPTAH